MTTDFFGYSIEVWQLLFAAGILMVAMEIFVPGFVLLPIGLGLILSALFAPVIHSWPLMMVVIAVNITVVLYLMHRFVKPMIESDSVKSNANGMIGKVAIVIEEITTTTGRVKLYGDEWRAFTSDQEKIEKGAQVTIEKIDGNKVQVRLLV